MSTFGALLSMIDQVPRTLDNEPGVSAPDYAMVARRLEEAAAKVRVMGECRAAVATPPHRPRLRSIPGGAHVRR